MPGRTKRSYLLLPVCLTLSDNISLSLSSFFALLFALSLHLSLPFSMPPPPPSLLSLHILTVSLHFSSCLSVCLSYLYLHTRFTQSFFAGLSALCCLPLSPSLFVYCSFCRSTKTLLFPPAVTISGHFGSARKSLGPAPLGLISICLQQR